MYWNAEQLQGIAVLEMPLSPARLLSPVQWNLFSCVVVLSCIRLCYIRPLSTPSSEYDSENRDSRGRANKGYCAVWIVELPLNKYFLPAFQSQINCYLNDKLAFLFSKRCNSLCLTYRIAFSESHIRHCNNSSLSPVWPSRMNTHFTFIAIYLNCICHLAVLALKCKPGKSCIWTAMTKHSQKTFVDGGVERRGKSLNLTACSVIYGWWMRRSRKGL